MRRTNPAAYPMVAVSETDALLRSVDGRDYQVTVRQPHDSRARCMVLTRTAATWKATKAVMTESNFMAG